MTSLHLANPIRIVTADPSFAAMVRETIEGKLSPAVEVCGNLRQMDSHLSKDAVAGIVVDLGPQPEQAIRQLEPIIASHPASRFVLVCERPHEGMMAEAMQAGARRLLARGNVRTSLAGILERVLIHPAASASQGGRMITLLSASGGCGATTLAVNLAEEITHLGAPSALLADLDWTYGGLATYLGLKGEFGLADVLAHPAPDASLVRTCTVSRKQAMNVLLSPGSIRFGCDIPAIGNLPAAMNACKSAYPCTIVDAPRVPLSVATVLARLSFRTVIVLQPTIKDVYAAKQLRMSLSEALGGRAIGAVVNRYHPRRTGVPLEQCRQAIQAAPLVVLPSDFKDASRAADLGQPFSQACPGSKLRKHVQQLARQLWADIPLSQEHLA